MTKTVKNAALILIGQDPTTYAICADGWIRDWRGWLICLNTIDVHTV